MPNSVISQESHDYRVVVFGAANVGKSSIMQRFVHGTFRDGYVPTIEDTYRKVMKNSENKVCSLQVTDTTGTHQFPAMQRLSIQKGSAFILVYAVNSKQSLLDLKPIHDEIVDIKGQNTVPVMLVGNKTDVGDKRQVTTAEGKHMASQWDCGFVETSAKNNYMVEDIFDNLLKLERHRKFPSNTKTKERSKAARRADGIKNKCVLM